MERRASETAVAEGVVRVDKSLIMELRVCCGKGVDITLCVHSFSMAYPQRNGTYPRCPRLLKEYIDQIFWNTQHEKNDH